MDIKLALKDLTNKYGVSGYENDISEYCVKLLEKYGCEAHIDNMGNVIGLIPSKNKNAKKIMLEAHMDQVGFLVSDIDDDGNISFVSVGGIDIRILPCIYVEILGRKVIKGVVNAPLDADAADKSVDIKKLRIFTGYTNDELKDIIQIGDTVVFDIEGCELLCDCMMSGSMDNRSGITAILYTLEMLKNKELDCDLYVMFSTQEEIGLRGAFTGTYNINPDLAIVVDVTHGTTVDSAKDSGVFDLGSGAVILRGPNVDYHKTKQLLALAKENNIKNNIEVAGGASGTTAWAIQTVRCGVPSLLISIPLRYMHTNVEVLKSEDVESVGKLMAIATEFFGKEQA